MIQLTLKIFLVLFTLSIYPSCKQENPQSNILIEQASNLVHAENIPFDFENPEVLILESSLKEISGLAYREDSNTLVCHNDELGNIYELDIKDGSIINTIKFSKNADYESISEFGNSTIVVENNGKLYHYNKETGETSTSKTILKRKNDVEGSCKIPNENALLLACKGQTLEDDKKQDKKAIYKYDLLSYELDENPYLEIKDEDLIKYFESKKVELSDSTIKKHINRIKSFAPSGIAFDPLTNNLFIISAKGSLLYIYKNKSIKEIIFLNSKTNPQPEGICFDNSGNLYISTEGKGFSGKIFKYSRQ